MSTRFLAFTAHYSSDGQPSSAMFYILFSNLSLFQPCSFFPLSSIAINMQSRLQNPMASASAHPLSAAPYCPAHYMKHPAQASLGHADHSHPWPVFHVTFPQHNASAATLAFLPPPHSAPLATQDPLMATDGWIRGNPRENCSRTSAPACPTTDSLQPAKPRKASCK